MFDRGLLERLEEATDTPVATQERGSIARCQVSVLENLRSILNVRQGCCETRPDFGMPDLNDVISQGSDAVLVVARAVKQQIEMFEPRLTNVVVRYEPDPDDPLRFPFHIGALLRYGDESERITFDTILSDDKRIRVRG